MHNVHHGHNGSMRGLLLTGVGHMEVHDIAIPEPGPDEVRIRLRQAGICGSDLHIYAGHFKGIPHPLTTGHEGLGIVEKCGENVSPDRLGQRVVIEPNFPCLKCRYCQRGQGNICPNKRIFGVRETGCFAQYAVVPAEFVWAVPEGVSDDDAVMIEPSAVALHALQLCSAKPGDAIAVVGLGAIGLLVTHIALSLGYQVLVNDKITQKMDLPVSWGAIATSEASGGPDGDSAEALGARLEEAGVLAVVEAAGSPKGTALAMGCAPRGAEVVLVGLSLEPLTIVPSSLTRNGTHVLTSMIYDHPADFQRVIDLVAAGTIQPSKIISSRTNLENLPATFERLMAQSLETKVIVDF